MKENQEIQDRIDRFLLDQMNDAEKEFFNVEMDNDPELKKTVVTQKMIVEEIKERESFMAILEDAEKSGELTLNDSSSIIQKSETSIKKRKTFKINYRWTIPIAAAIIGIALIIWQPHKNSNQNIYNTYALAYASENIINSDNTVKSRGGDTYFENLNPSDNTKITEALTLYHDGEFSSAKIIFKEVLVPRGKNNELVLYMAIAELFSNDTDKAINNLNYLCNLKDYEFNEQSTFYLALAYIKTNQINKARGLLSHLEEGDSEYAAQAAEMLNKMRWF